jgi:hypothetical protein
MNGPRPVASDANDLSMDELNDLKLYEGCIQLGSE